MPLILFTNCIDFFQFLFSICLQRLIFLVKSLGFESNAGKCNVA